MGQNRGVVGLPAPRVLRTDDERLKWDTRVYDAIGSLQRSLDSNVAVVRAFILDTNAAAAADASSTSNLWQRHTSGFLAPTTIADIVSIGSLTAPYNSYDLGLWHAGGLAHCYATAAAGTGATRWRATLDGTTAAFDNDVGTWNVGTETSNSLVFAVNGTPCVGVAMTPGAINRPGLGDLVPLRSATSNLGYAIGFRWKSLYLMDGSIGNNFGISFSSANLDSNAYITHVNNGSFTMTPQAGSSADTFIGCGNFISGAVPNFVYLGNAAGNVMAKAGFWGGTTMRFLPGADATIDLGGVTGGANDERWQSLYLANNCYLTNLYPTGLVNGASASVAAAATLTLTTNLTLVTGNTNIDFITTTGILAGTVIVLNFSGTPTVNHNTGAVPGGTAAIFLAGAANFAATANDTLTLVYNGTVWAEVARTVI